MMSEMLATLPEAYDDAQAALLDAGVTDGLPVVPPTRERVERMLQASGCDPQASVAVLPPSFGNATWRELAVNAVMAGCRDDYLPVIGAAVAALADDAFNLLGIATTTGSATPLVIVGGPIVGRLGMNCGANALGPGNRANATIGRAVHLAMQNIGGARPGELDMATLGQPGKFTFCCAENEAESPWPSLHARRGRRPEDSVVTVVGAAGIVEIADGTSRTPDDLARSYGASTLVAGTVGGAGLLGGGEPLFIVPPEHARLFHDGGFTLDRVRSAIHEHAALPVDKLSADVRDRLTTPGGVIRVATTPDDILVVVAGGVGRKGAYVPTWGGGTRAVSRVI
jgi:hypothetical protein